MGNQIPAAAALPLAVAETVAFESLSAKNLMISIGLTGHPFRQKNPVSF
jgi:hypothetical protein